MVAKRSEYQNQFRATTVRRHQPTYRENVNIRHSRRDREYLHTPICWEEQEGEEIEASSSSEETTGPCSRSQDGQGKCYKSLAQILRDAREYSSNPAVQTKYKSLAQILDDSKEKARLHRIKPSQSSTDNDEGKDNNNNNGQTKGIERLSVDAVEESQEIQKDNNCILCDLEDKNGKKLSKTAEDNLIDHEKDVGDKSYSIHDIVEQENKKLHKKIGQQTILGNVEKLKDMIKDESNIDVRGPKKMTEEANLRKNPFAKKKSRGQKTFKVLRSPAVEKGRKPLKKDLQTHSPPDPLPPRVRRPDRQPRPASRPQSAPQEVSERPPFIGYGAGDIEDNLADHRTHNVRASADVYGAALKAKQRRELERSLRKKKEEQRARREALLEKLGEVTPRDRSDWQSEYRKQFLCYDLKDYERAVSARAVVPRVPLIRAVHRGGPVLVHVD